MNHNVTSNVDHADSDAAIQEDIVSTAEERLDLAELERPALESALEAQGCQRFHAGQIFRWIYRRGLSDLAAEPTTPKVCQMLCAAFSTLAAISTRTGLCRTR